MPESKSVLSPVGIVSSITTGPLIRGGATTIGIAHIDLSLAPVGSELYVQPKDSRLKLEVEVANDNALHWKDGLNKANERSARLRTELLKAKSMLRNIADYHAPSPLTAEIMAFLTKE